MGDLNFQCCKNDLVVITFLDEHVFEINNFSFDIGSKKMHVGLDK